MAIKNFIKEGTYTKIVNIQWRDGYPTLCVVATYEKAPSGKYVPFKEVDSKDEDGNDVKVSAFQTPENSMGETKIDLSDVTSDYSTWNTYFASDKWTAKNSNIHAQLYKYLLSTSLFEGCESDE
ncbi:uncharacterized protein METZ01_LOCUS495306 [marine metagenome]|jgi:hypothetical protein|uniref:Uncharacterized protein n=1 Tax=marine metagenome TaxID=408172 RepID=A0A383DD91_9ZZZZ